MYLSQCVNRAVQINPRGIATNFGHNQRTYLEFRERIQRLAGGMQALGLEVGDRAAILSLNSDCYLESFYAVPWAGGIIVPVNIRLAVPEILFTLNDSEAKVLLVDETFAQMLPSLEGKMNSVEIVIYIGAGTPPPNTVSYDAVIDDALPIEDSGRGGDDVAGLFYTGGTTGRSKGVMLTHENLICNAMNIVAAQKINKDSAYLHAAPMFHLADCASTFAITLVGGEHSFVPKFDANDVLVAIGENRVTNCLLVPTMINILVNFPGLEDYDLSSLKKIMYGASPMPLALLKKAMEVLPNCLFAQGYGMTETAPLLTFLDTEYHVLEGPLSDKLTSVGCAALSVELKVVDEDDLEVVRGEVGEIIARGPMVMRGYWKQPEMTQQALRNGWMHTGDLGRMDEDGFVFIVDRSKDMIVTGGENVYSTEVENALYQHPLVQECAVIGIPHSEWGEAVHAVVVLKDPQEITEQEIKTHCSTLIANYKVPKSVSFDQGPLPVSGAGKILKTELRKPFWAGAEKQVN